jgi:hypothetical protein
MFAFLRRRTSAAAEALILAILAAMVAGLSGVTAIAEDRGPGAWDPIAVTEPVGQTLAGVLTIERASEQADGTHWMARLDTGDGVVPVRLSHEDSHRSELMGADVQVEGIWSEDGSFVAAAIDPVDPAREVALASDSGLAGTGAGEGTTLEGVLSFRHGDDIANGRRTVTRYVLTTDAGEVEVAFDHLPSAALAGSRVRLEGVRNGKQLVVADGGTTQVAATTSATTVSTGSKRVAVVLVNFSNDTSQPYTPAFAAGIAFTNTDSVAAYHAEGSWGQLTLSGDVFGWLTIPNTNANCAYSTWASSANTVAGAAGINLAAYDNVVYAFPKTSCGWAGLASMPGRNSWLNGPMAMSLRVMAHELGHNFGTHHASQYGCMESGVRVTLSVNTANCTSGEYGDPFSVMGQATRYEHTNFAKGNFNWLAPANTQNVTVSGDYLLTPAEIQAGTVSSLRIQRTTSAWFTMEFRQPYGSYFETFPSTAPLATGVTIRITAGYTSRSQSQLLDMTPSTSSFIDAPLAAGRTFVDPLTGVSVTTLSTSSAGALVRVSFAGGAVPTTSPPPTSTPAPTSTSGPTPTPSPTSTPSPSATPSPSLTPSPSPTPRPDDTQAPTEPGNLTATIARSKRVALTWTASSDNVKVTGYRVYRDGVLVASVNKTKWTDGLRFSAEARRYEVVAFDAAGNVSPPTAVTVE